MPRIDFQGLADELLRSVETLLPEWLPGGKIYGKEYRCGDLTGSPGDSLSINMTSGKWSDFATGDRGGDLISLYAAIKRINQAEAAKALMDNHAFIVEDYKPPKPKPDELKLSQPPTGTSTPPFKHTVYGPPQQTWCYKDESGNPVFYTARYMTANGKQFNFFSYSMTMRRWVRKAFPSPRPLYGLEKLADNPDMPILIVEGEKCKDAAEKFIKNYLVVTWSGGSGQVDKSDWSALEGRTVVIWADGDLKVNKDTNELLPSELQPGMKASIKIGRILEGYKCPEIKIIDPGTDVPCDGWDAADALEAGWDYGKFLSWAKGKAKRLPEFNTTQEPLKEEEKKESEDDWKKSHRSLFRMWNELGLDCNSKGIPYPTQMNIARILSKDYPDRFGYDIFNRKLVIKKDQEYVSLETNDALYMTQIIQGKYGIHNFRGENTMYSCISGEAKKNEINIVKDWMETLKWDGTERISKFFHSYMGADDTKLNEAISNNFWTALASRIYKPGCKMDNMIVLEGKQGIGKTRALQAIGGEWYKEISLSMLSDEFVHYLRGTMIVEVSELQSFRKTDANRIKQIISTNVDNYRRKYGRDNEDHPRTCLLVGTTNDDDYLTDVTGNRRFWPVACNEIHVQKIINDRDQLFAEGIERFKAGYNYFVVPQDELDAVHSARMSHDEWLVPIQAYIEGLPHVLIIDIYREALGGGTSRCERRDQIRIANILKGKFLNWRKEKRMINGKQNQYWFPPGSLIEDTPEPSENGHPQPAPEKAPPLKKKKDVDFYGNEV